MFDFLLTLVQTICCLVIFVTGVTWLSGSLPLWKGSARCGFKLLADALVASAALIQAFRPADGYFLVMLVGLTISYVAHRDSGWFRWIWDGRGESGRDRFKVQS